MSADKYAQFIAEQQRKLSVSGTNTVELIEKKHMSKADIAALKEPKDKFDEKDLEALRNKEHLKKEDYDPIKKAAKDELEKAGKPLHNVNLAFAGHHMGHDAVTGTTEKAKNRFQNTYKWHLNKSEKKAVNKFTPSTKKALGEVEEELISLDDTMIDEKARTADELKSKIKQHRIGHTVTPESDWPKKKRHLQATSAAERMLAKLPKSKGGESVTKQGINPVGATKTQWKNKKWNEETELDDTMIEENVLELAEAMRRGDLPEYERLNRDLSKHHMKLANSHADMADKAHELGDEEGFEHHFYKSSHHGEKAEIHGNIADRAAALGAKVKAKKDLKDAGERLAKANDVRKNHIGY